MDELSPGFDDLRRDEHHGMDVAFEFHLEKLRSFFLGLDMECLPDFHIPRERGHDHVRPISDEVSRWHAHGMDSVLELLDEILLMTPVVGFKDNFFR